MSKLYLRQTFERHQMGAMGAIGGTSFDWSIDRSWPDVTRIGSWEANYYFPVKTGKTAKATLGNARRVLAARARKHGEPCTFEYIER